MLLWKCSGKMCIYSCEVMKNLRCRQEREEEEPTPSKRVSRVFFVVEDAVTLSVCRLSVDYTTVCGSYLLLPLLLCVLEATTPSITVSTVSYSSSYFLVARLFSQSSASSRFFRKASCLAASSSSSSSTGMCSSCMPRIRYKA